MSQMLKEKTLNAHPDKSGILVLGSSTFQARIKEEMKIQQIQLNKFSMKLKNEEKYLGQILESNLAPSAGATVKNRSGKIKGAALEIKLIIEDYQMQALGGLAAAWDLWERALNPSLLCGSETSERQSS